MRWGGKWQPGPGQWKGRCGFEGEAEGETLGGWIFQSDDL